MKPKINICRHGVNSAFCFVCDRERKASQAAQAEKERKQKEWEAAHPDKHKAARKVLGLES